MGKWHSGTLQTEIGFKKKKSNGSLALGKQKEETKNNIKKQL